MRLPERLILVLVLFSLHAVYLILTGHSLLADHTSVFSLPSHISNALFATLHTSLCAVYLILTEVVRRAGLVERISGLKPGRVPEASPIPLAVNSNGNEEPTKSKVVNKERMYGCCVMLPDQSQIFWCCLHPAE